MAAPATLGSDLQYVASSFEGRGLVGAMGSSMPRTTAVLVFPLAMRTPDDESTALPSGQQSWRILPAACFSVHSSVLSQSSPEGFDGAATRGTNHSTTREGHKGRKGH